LYYKVEHSDDDLETITDEPDSALLLLQELYVAITDAQEKQTKATRRLQARS
jgi:hypothetical protein